VLHKGEVEAVFAECTGLTSEIEVQEYQEGGENEFVHKLPGRVKWSNITLKRGMSDSLSLWEWFQSTVKNSLGLEKLTKREIEIHLFDETHTSGLRWAIKNAYPIKWEGPAMRADGNAVAIETLVLVHEGFTLTRI
jgi:phage tail-like protein